MIPLENSSAGRVSEIHNLLQKHAVSIIAEHFVLIEHHLAALDSARLEDIKRIYSHPQALLQCKNNLRDLGVELSEFSNTAEAARFVAEKGDKSKAALCSKLAAKLNGLQVIKEHLQDSRHNSTTFITIAKEAIDPDPKISPVIISLMFTIKNYPGSLYKALGSFATNSVSMMQIESFIRGSIQAPGGVSKEAAFFVTIEGHPKQENVALALRELEFFAKNVKILGVYPADKSRV
jgi:prephenate dehydratase